MHLAAGEFPDQPGINIAEQQLPCLGPFAGAGDGIQDPAQLGGREIGVDGEARLFAEGFHQPLALELVAEQRGSPALPDNGGADGLAGGFFPYHRGFTLVGDADGRNVFGGEPRLFHCAPGHLQLGLPDLFGVMLHPAGLREILVEFLLVPGQLLPFFVEQDAAVGGCAAIQSHDVLGQNEAPFFWFLGPFARRTPLLYKK